MSNRAENQNLLFSKIGEKGSGYGRYGAAMYFYKAGELPYPLLEIYRRCCKFDREDPIALAKFESLDTLPLEKLKPGFGR